ncbi:MAG: stalk domain-containing protein [Caldisericia bacterium]|nr:stalk domain-containing protein [Caldisericia bacterium]
MRLALKWMSIVCIVLSLSSCSIGTLFQSKPSDSSSTEAPSQKESSTTEMARFSLKVGSPIIYVNDIPLEFDIAVQEIDGRTMIPLSFFKDFCQMQDLYYEASNETISFSMPVQKTIIPTESNPMSLETPGTPGIWYEVTFEDEFTGKTTLAMMIDNVNVDKEAAKIVAQHNPFAQQASETEQYTTFDLHIKLVSLESTDHYPLDDTNIHFTDPTGKTLLEEQVLRLQDQPVGEVLQTNQLATIPYAILNPVATPAIFSFIGKDKEAIFITIRNP